MENIKWNKLLRAIKNEGTILFIGPDIERNESGEPVFQTFAKRMLEEYEGEVEIDRDGFFFFTEPDAKSEVVV